MVTLTIQPPGASPVTHVLKDETITIGRMSGNTIVINDSSVSLVHAKITRKNGEFFLKDLNSTNGTLVNNQPITEAKLRNRDAVRFADVTGQFTLESAEVETAAPAPVVPASQLPASLLPPAGPKMPGTPDRAQVPRSRPLAPILAAVVGGVAAVAVISLVAWNVLHQRKVEEASAAVSSAAEAKQKNSVARETPKTAPGTPMIPAPLPPSPATSAVETADQATGEVTQLIKTLQDPDPAERRQAVAALHSMGPSAASATPALHQALSDPDQEVRLWAALALINIKSYDKAIPPILIHVLHDEKPMLRQLACVSLGLIPYERAEKEAVVPALIAAAKTDSDEDVRKAANAALGVIDPEAVTK